MSAPALSWKEKWGNTSYILVVCFTFAHIAVLALGLKFLFPAVWARELHAGFVANIAVFLAFSAFNCFLEYFIHRYMLHAVVASWFRDIARRHGRHHGLTVIVIDWMRRKIINRYAIERPEQYESVAFPNYTFAGLLGFCTAVIVPLQIMFPGAPLLFGGYAAAAVSYGLYEIMHQLEHKSDAWWEAHRRNPAVMYFGTIYKSHKFHHLAPKYNMAIVGLLGGIPLADYVFGTFWSPDLPLADGVPVTEYYLARPEPCRLIGWLDRRAKTREKRLLAECSERKRIKMALLRRNAGE
ncbi:MAG TPA: hypothetical protein VNG29_01530 [Candidatus Paceibacterota bacterium]|nr:hypothetical protein [Candidatus Paceibacterota bacterium]